MSDVDDFLAHYGVKGMKWGQRKAAKKAARANESPEERKARRLATFDKVSSAAIVGGLAAFALAPAASQFMQYHMATAINDMNAASNARAAADFMADRGLTNYITIVQK